MTFPTELIPYKPQSAAVNPLPATITIDLTDVLQMVNEAYTKL